VNSLFYRALQTYAASLETIWLRSLHLTRRGVRYRDGSAANPSACWAKKARQGGKKIRRGYQTQRFLVAPLPNVTRQIVLPTSSATSNAPCLSSATPTALPSASPFSRRSRSGYLLVAHRVCLHETQIRLYTRSVDFDSKPC
jgi:hypothetical protein